MSRIEDDEPPIKTGVTSNAYRENWDRIFGEKEPKPLPATCEKCARAIDDININWNAPHEPVCVVCAR